MGAASSALRCQRRDPHRWRRQFIAATDPMSERELRVVTLRMSGLAPSEIAHKIGQSRMDRIQVERLCLAAAVRLAVDEGETGWDLTPGSDTGRRLVQEGLPTYSTEVRQAKEFTSLWLAGRPLAEIRDILSLSEAHAKRLSRVAAPRWNGRQIAAHLGWSRENHRLRLARGHFPAPDGREGRSDWWWPVTVTDWVSSQRLRPCPSCGARVAKLTQHMKAHT